MLVHDIDSYQHFTRTTAFYPEALHGNQQALTYLALGLVSEAGEVADKLKKRMRDGCVDHTSWEIEVLREIGDVFWYAARIADELGYQASVVLDINADKLTSRQDRGELGGSGDDR